LRSAWNYLQVVPTIEKNNTLIKQAVRAIKESPPEHVGWRAWRSMRHLLTIPGNGRISYEARLRLLLEYPVGCIVAAKVRNKQYMDLASRGYEAKPEVQLVNTVRSMLLDVAAQLHKELATD
jgi:hypothetical protein